MGTQPENTHGIQTQTQHNPYPKFGSGSGITLGYPNFGCPIPAIVDTKEAGEPKRSQFTFQVVYQTVLTIATTFWMLALKKVNMARPQRGFQCAYLFR